MYEGQRHAVLLLLSSERAVRRGRSDGEWAWWRRQGTGGGGDVENGLGLGK